MNSNLLNLLLIEDCENDAYLILEEFRQYNYQISSRRVDNASDLREALDSQSWDAVICDYALPQFNAMEALSILRSKDVDLPCIVVSGSVGEEKAVQTMKAGAQDYILKDRLTRLVPAVVREIKEAGERRRRYQAEDDLDKANSHLRSLKRFFPPQIADVVLSGKIDDPFKWHRNHVTVLFVDLRGFTSFAEVADPEDVMMTLQKYYSSLARIAHRHGGSVGHLAGDGVMIFFNDPIPVPDAECRAVKTALEARQSLYQLCKTWEQQGFTLNFGIGIACGYATIGGIGEEGFWDYTIIGTVTNLASRLCSEAQQGQILVPQRLLSVIESQVDCDPLGHLSFKGLQQPVAVFNIVREKESSAA